VYRGADPITVNARLEYFLEVSRCVALTKFESKTEKRIMELFCEGLKKKEIREKMRCGKDTILRVVRKWLTLYGLHGK
jgi:hypothetical protein